MRGFEERWAVATLGSFAPERAEPATGLLAPRPGEVDYLAALEAMMAGSNRLARFGLRLALWLVALSPLWAQRRLKTIAGLEGWQRTELLHRLLEHPVYLVRELCLLLKVVTCMALLQPGPVRERTDYDTSEETALPRVPVAELPAANTDQEVA
ncbi:MAG: hypothetical protein P1V51_11110 [Deltaproteobacteria bacterium]|nr:hypothetical protein [Deltaproteobacteria bacterium]